MINSAVITRALEEGHGLSGSLSHFLVAWGIALPGQVRSFSLNDLARTNQIEHDTSLVHDDTKDQDEYVPTSPNATLIEQLMEEVKCGVVGICESRGTVNCQVFTT